MHLCAELIAASMTLEPLGEVGAKISLQLSSREQFAKINNKKVIAENQCEKHKKSSFFFLVILCGLLITYATSFDTDHIHKCRCLILIQIVRHSGGVIEFSDLYFLFI